MKYRFPRFQTSGTVRTMEKILHYQYNEMMIRKNIRRSRFYDFYKTKHGIEAKHFFEILAEKLLERKIDPIRYLKVMSNYGQSARTNYLMKPKWMMSDKAFEVYSWLSKIEAKKYPDKESMMKGLTLGSEVKDKEILEAIKQSSVHNDMSYAELYALRDTVSEWYFAILPDFTHVSNPVRLMFERSRYKQILNCVAYLKTHNLIGKAVRASGRTFRWPRLATDKHGIYRFPRGEE